MYHHESTNMVHADWTCADDAATMDREYIVSETVTFTVKADQADATVTLKAGNQTVTEVGGEAKIVVLRGTKVKYTVEETVADGEEAKKVEGETLVHRSLTQNVSLASGETRTYVGKGCFVLNESESLSMYSKNGKTSQKVEAKFYKIPKGRKVKVLSKYNNQYTAGGDEGLIDQKRGGDNWKLGLWQGYWGEDFVAVLELTDGEKPSRLGANFIQDQKSWIFLPVEVAYYVSDNGKDYKLLEIVKNDMPERNEEILQKAFYTSKPINHRFVKVVAKNIKTNPSWHLSAGEKSWLFTDELIIEF
jgi:hypothetical protein